MPADRGAHRPAAATTGWRPGPGPTPRCPTRSTRSCSRRRRAPTCCAARRAELDDRRYGRRRCPPGRRHRRWPALLSQLLRGERSRPPTNRLGDGAGHVRRGDRRADRRLRRRAARQGRDARRGRPAWCATMLDAAPRRSPSTGRRSTPAAPAATGRTPSTSRRWPRMVVAGAGAPGGQARQPGRVVGLRLGRPARGARRRRRPRAGRGRRVPATEAGIAFCFAPVFHPALRHAAVPRRELGVPTVFNFLGPLTNPAQPAAQAVGVRRRADGGGDGAACSPTRGASALVFRGDDGLDELTTDHHLEVWVVRGRRGRREQVVDPATLGLARADAGRRCAAATRRTTPRSHATVPGGRARAGARRGAAQRRGRAGRPATRRRRRSATGCRARRTLWRPGRARPPSRWIGRRGRRRPLARLGSSAYACDRRSRALTGVTAG